MFLQAWVAQSASLWIVSILWEGYHLEFGRPPSLSFFAPVIMSSKNLAKMEILHEQFHINLLEMRAVAKALLGFSLPLGAMVLGSSDNSTIVSYISRQEEDTLFAPLEGDRIPIPVGYQSADLPLDGPHSMESEFHC